jgi:ABC-type nitrate/sulfonate/bicarbonate transport system substrate-binding protein
MSHADRIQLLQFRAAYNLPVHAGIENGIFARHRLDIDAAYTPGSAFLCRALKHGRCDVGHTAADDIVADVESDQRSDLFLFMGLHGGLFSLIGAPGIRSIDSLRNQTIGVDAKASGFALVLDKYLRARGFARDDYQLTEIGGWERRYAALLDGKISATLLTEPFIDDAVRQGCRLLARNFEMMPTYQGTCGAASRRWAKQHPGKLIRYIHAYVEATEWCFKRANRGACLALLARHNGLSGAAAERALDGLLDPAHGLYPKAALNLAGVAAAVELRAELGYLARPAPPVEKYVDPSYHRMALSPAAG